MKMFRFWGDVRVSFIHTIEAESEEAAWDIVSDTRLRDLDDTCEKEGMDIQGSVELDEDGEEIYGEENASI